MDTESKQIRSKRILSTANATSPSSAAECRHENVHHKDSSRYLRSTCKDCGESWQEERNAPTQDPDSFPHRHTDHRGSNKHVRKTFCIDCGTYMDSVSRDLAKELQDENPWRSKEEQILIDSVSDHEHISREQAIWAAKMLVVDCEQLEPGDYTMLSLANMFIDCRDRAIAASDVRMFANKRVGFAEELAEERHAYVFTEEQRLKLRKTSRHGLVWKMCLSLAVKTHHLRKRFH